MQHGSDNPLSPDHTDLFSSIDPVSQDGMADRLQVGPYLVCTSGLRMQQDQGGDRTERFLDLIHRHGHLGVARLHRGPFGILSIRADGTFDPTISLRRHPPDQGFIVTGNGMALELLREPAMRFRCLGDDHHS